jgi:hypothetical protein
MEGILHKTEPLYCHLGWHLMKVILVIVIIGDNAVSNHVAVVCHMFLFVNSI